MNKLKDLFFLVAVMMMVNMMIDPIHVERHFRVNTCMIGNSQIIIFKKTLKIPDIIPGYSG